MTQMVLTGTHVQVGEQELLVLHTSRPMTRRQKLQHSESHLRKGRKNKRHAEATRRPAGPKQRSRDVRIPTLTGQRASSSVNASRIQMSTKTRMSRELAKNHVPNIMTHAPEESGPTTVDKLLEAHQQRGIVLLRRNGEEVSN